MKKWEYKVIVAAGNRVVFVDAETTGNGILGTGRPFLHELLNLLAEDGWEPIGSGMSHGQIILRRAV